MKPPTRATVPTRNVIATSDLTRPRRIATRGQDKAVRQSKKIYRESLLSSQNTDHGVFHTIELGYLAP